VGSKARPHWETKMSDQARPSGSLNAIEGTSVERCVERERKGGLRMVLKNRDVGCGLRGLGSPISDYFVIGGPSYHSLPKERTICALDWVDIRALGRHRQDHRTAKTDDTLGTEYRIRVSRLRLRRSALSFEHSLDLLSPWTSALTGSPLHLVGVGV
jgi:hypothetical protein